VQTANNGFNKYDIIPFKPIFLEELILSLTKALAMNTMLHPRSPQERNQMELQVLSPPLPRAAQDVVASTSGLSPFDQQPAADRSWQSSSSNILSSSERSPTISGQISKEKRPVTAKKYKSQIFEYLKEDVSKCKIMNTSNWERLKWSKNVQYTLK
jgi:hypothetical protein